MNIRRVITEQINRARTPPAQSPAAPPRVRPFVELCTSLIEEPIAKYPDSAKKSGNKVALLAKSVPFCTRAPPHMKNHPLHVAENSGGEKTVPDSVRHAPKYIARRLPALIYS
jgi:hypothetical protein